MGEDKKKPAENPEEKSDRETREALAGHRRKKRGA
jgi:hypothetical protein